MLARERFPDEEEDEQKDDVLPCARSEGPDGEVLVVDPDTLLELDESLLQSVASEGSALASLDELASLCVAGVAGDE